MQHLHPQPQKRLRGADRLHVRAELRKQQLNQRLQRKARHGQVPHDRRGKAWSLQSRKRTDFLEEMVSETAAWMLGEHLENIL